MGPRKPEIEYISLRKLQSQKEKGVTDLTKEAYKSLEKLANNALKSDPFSITIEKKPPHIAPSGDPRDFLSYAPYWWPENPNDINTKYIRKDGKRNPDIAIVKDQTNLEAIAESLTFLCLGFYLLMNENYAKHAVTLLDAFFVNESTRMNPNLNYAQFIRGPQNTTKLGRGEGVISARFLTRIANLLPLLTNYGGYNAIQQPVYNWFNAYLNWLKTSPVALEAANAKNNIHSWYNVQLAAIEQYVNPASPDIPNRLRHFFNQTVPKQIDRRTGDQPLESQRTRPFHYLAFNLQAILFLTELAYDYGIEIGPMTPPLIRSATCHISKFADDPNVDITVAARCAEIVVGRLEDPNNTCHNFIQRAHTCKFSEKLSGPKNALSILWS